MARQKVTISPDRHKADKARALVGLRRDIAAYRRVPPTDAEGRIAELAASNGLTDQTDWEALYPEGETDH
jgi:hypothetical protein